MVSLSIKCPLCGKQSPESSLHPEELDDDVYTVEVRGLGRGRGFANSEPTSAFDNPANGDLIGKIAERALSIVALMVEREYLGKSDVLEKIGYNDFLDKIVEDIGTALEEDPASDWVVDEEDPSYEPTRMELLRHGVYRLIERFEEASPDEEE